MRQLLLAGVALAAMLGTAAAADKAVTVAVSIPAADHGWTGGVVFQAERAKALLRENPDIANRIETSIRQNAGLLADRILETATPTEDDLDEGAA